MLFFGIGIGALLFVLGLVTYVFAPRVGPNPIFGVRVGYTFASRAVWDKTNRFGGALIALVGLGTTVLGVLLQVLGVAPNQGMVVLTVLMIVAMMVSTGAMFAYARQAAQSEPIVRETAPAKFRWAYLVPVLLTFAILVALALYFYPQLSATRVATHFNFAEQPDGWQTRDEFFIMFLGIAGLVSALDVVVVIVATREPLIAYGRWGDQWHLDPERGLLYTGFALALTNLIFIAALWDIGWYNTRGAHAFPLWLFLGSLIPLIAILIGSFFLLARRVK